MPKLAVCPFWENIDVKTGSTSYDSCNAPPQGPAATLDRQHTKKWSAERRVTRGVADGCNAESRALRRRQPHSGYRRCIWSSDEYGSIAQVSACASGINCALTTRHLPQILALTTRQLSGDDTELTTEWPLGRAKSQNKMSIQLLEKYHAACTHLMPGDQCTRCCGCYHRPRLRSDAHVRFHAPDLTERNATLATDALREFSCWMRHRTDWLWFIRLSHENPKISDVAAWSAFAKKFTPFWERHRMLHWWSVFGRGRANGAGHHHVLLGGCGESVVQRIASEWGAKHVDMKKYDPLAGCRPNPQHTARDGAWGAAEYMAEDHEWSADVAFSPEFNKRARAAARF